MKNKILSYHIINFITFSGILLFSVASNLYNQNISFEKTKEGIWLLENGNPRFFYQTETKSFNNKYPRANYIHPLIGMDGDTITEDFPKDHPHHRGIFWAWHQLYVGEERLADPWDCEGIEWKVTDVKTNIKNHTGNIKSTVHWIIKTEGSRFYNQPVLKEDVSITYKKLQIYYELDFTINFTALVDSLKFGGSKDSKGYGGFSARFKLPPDLKFFHKNMEITPLQTPVDCGGWVEIIGKNPQDIHRKMIAIIMCEPEKLPSFQGWILRKRGSIQNAAFPGKNPILLLKGRPLVMRNRIVILDKYLQPADFELMYRRFLGQRGR